MSEIQVLLRVEEAADALRIGRTVMYGLIKSGAISSVLIGRSRRVSVDAVKEYAKKLESNAA